MTNNEEDVWKDWLGDSVEEPVVKKEDDGYIDDSNWENANLSQGKRSDINHQYSTHPHSLHQRRRRNR